MLPLLTDLTVTHLSKCQAVTRDGENTLAKRTHAQVQMQAEEIQSSQVTEGFRLVFQTQLLDGKQHKSNKNHF